MARKNSYANLYIRLPNEEKLLLDVIDLDDLDSSSDSFLSDIIEADRCIVSRVDDSSQNMINTGVNVSTTAGKDVLESSQDIFNLEDLSPSQDRHDNSTSSRDIICQNQHNLIPVAPRDCSVKKELTSPTDDRKQKSVIESCGSIALVSKMIKSVNNNTTNYDVPRLERLVGNGTSVKVQIKFGSENREEVNSDNKKRKNSSIESSKNSGLKHRRNSATSSNEESASLKCNSPNTAEISRMNPEKGLKTKVSEVCKNTAPNNRNMVSRKIKTSDIAVDLEKKTYFDKNFTSSVPKCRNNTTNYDVPGLERLAGNGTSVKVQIKFGSKNREEVNSDNKKRKNSSIESSKNSGLKHRKNSATSSYEESTSLKCNSPNTAEISLMNPEKVLKTKVSEVCKNTAPSDRNMDSRKFKTSGIAVDLEKKTYIDKKRSKLIRQNSENFSNPIVKYKTNSSCLLVDAVGLRIEKSTEKCNSSAAGLQSSENNSLLNNSKKSSGVPTVKRMNSNVCAVSDTNEGSHRNGAKQVLIERNVIKSSSDYLMSSNSTNILLKLISRLDVRSENNDGDSQQHLFDVDDASQNMINTGVNVSTTAGKDVLESSQHIFNLEDLSPSQDRHDNSTSSRDIICQKQQNLIPVDPRDCSTKKELTSPTDDRKKKSVTESCGSIELASKMSKSVNNNKVREMKKRKDSSSPPKCCNSKTNNYVPGLERLARSDSFMRVPIKSGSENEEILNRDCKRKNRHQKSSELKCRKNFSLGNNEECQTLKSNLPKTVEMSHVNPINKIKTEVSEVHKNISPNDRNMDSRKIHTSGIEVDIEKKTYIDKNLTSSVPKCRNKTTNYDVPRLERLVGNGTSVKVQIKFGSENQEKVTSEDKKRKNSSIERSKNSGLKHRRNSAISSNEESALLKCNSLNTGEISHMNPEKGLKAKVSEVCKNTAPNDRNMDSRKIKTSGIAVDVEKKTYIDKNLTSSVSKCRNNTTNYDVPGVERLAENGTSVKVQIKFGSENQEKVTSEDKKRKNSSIESSKNSGLKHRRNSATSSKEESASLKCSSPNTGEISYMNPEKVLKTKVSEVCKNTAPNDRNMDSRKIKTSGITTDVEKKTYIDKKRSKLIRQNSENFSNPIVKYKTNSSCLLVDAVGLRIEKSTEKCNSSAAGLQSSENNSLLNNSKKSSGVPTVKRMNSNVCAVSDTNGAKQVLIERNVIKSSSDYLISSNSTNILLKLNSRPDVRSENNDSQQHLFGNVNRNYCSSNNEIAGVTAASSESCKRVGVLPVVNASCMSEKVRQIFPAKRTKSKLSPLLDEMVTSSAGEAQIKRRRNSGMRNETPTAMNTPTKTPCESSSAISRSSPFKCLKDAAICHSAVSVSLDKSDVYKSSSKQSLQRRSYATYNCGKNINPSSMDKENSNVVSHSYTDYSAEIDSARSATTDKYSSNSDLPITSRPKSHDSFSIKKEQADEKESSFTSRISSEPDTVIISENKPVADSETGSAISPLIHSEDDDIQPFILELSLDEIKEKLGVPAKPSTLDKVYEADSTKGICYDHIGASAVKTEPVPLLSDYKSELNHDGLVMLQQIINLLELIKMSKEFFGLTGAVIEALLAEAELCKHNKTNKIFGILLEKSTLSALEMCKYLLKRRSSDTLSEVKKDNSLLSLKALDKMISIANVDIKVNIDALAETTNGLDQSQTWLFIKEFFEYKGLQFPSGDDFDSVCQRVLQKREQILDSVPAENIESYVDDKRKLILPLSSSLIGSKNATESCVLSSSSPDLKNCSKAPSAPNSDEHSKTVVNKTEYNYCDRIQSDLLPVSKVEEITAFMDKPHNPEPHQCGGSSGTNNEHSVEGVKESSSEVTPTSSRAGQTLKCIKKEELERLVANFLYFDKETQKAIKGYLKELLNTKENAEYASKHLRTINLLSS